MNRSRLYLLFVRSSGLFGLAALVCFLSILSSCNQNSTLSAEAKSGELDYNFHIRPILSDKCFACHGPDSEQRQAGLRLDTEEGAFAALKESPGKYAFVPGHPEQSEVSLRIHSEDSTELMPPPESNLKLSAEEIALIDKWIEQGAEYKPHWAFIKPLAGEIPEVSNTEWPKNEIDHFVLNKMEATGMSPNEEAEKSYLLKRLAFDLTGLPPTEDLQDRFMADNSLDAYEKAVDELLASPHYGEKLAIHWLDVARYADSHGYQDDGRRTMWPWRDWVIHAFNSNYPYDTFLLWQLAGDLIPNPTKETMLATGFNRNHKITQEGGIIQEEYRIEYVTDRTNTFGKAFLGLTFECAKCHDHKYDPISQEDYYSTFAFFNQVPEKGLYGDISRASLADPPRIKITSEEIKEQLSFINQKDTSSVQVMVMKDSVDVRPTYVLERGVYDQHGEEVEFALPETVFAFDTNKYASNRLGLAQWLLDEEHPLTARVFVNRIWQEFMGRGIVFTSEDFGMQGELPSHPELLDWLAVDFRENKWDVKRLVKQIVMSSTYRQSSVVSKKKLEADPENIHYARAPRLRLPAELVRDHALASSGLLNSDIGGPSIKPYQPKGIWEATTSGRGELAEYIQDHGNDLYRRGMYVFIKRTAPPPVMLMFDAPNRDQCEVRRMRTNTPLQALVMLNDPLVLESSRVLAEKLMLEDLSEEKRIETAFRRIICRPLKQEETQLFSEYYQEEKANFNADPEKAEAFLDIGEYDRLPIDDKASLAALMQVIHTMYNMEEAITKS